MRGFDIRVRLINSQRGKNRIHFPTIFPSFLPARQCAPERARFFFLGLEEFSLNEEALSHFPPIQTQWSPIMTCAPAKVSYGTAPTEDGSSYFSPVSKKCRIILPPIFGIRNYSLQRFSTQRYGFVFLLAISQKNFHRVISSDTATSLVN